MNHLVLIIAYDGTNFLGWQSTKEGPSIEATLTSVIEQILQEKVTLRAASRTDRGVHADYQVVDLFTSRSGLNPSKLRISLNQLLPRAIICKELFFIDDQQFHPSTDALQKTYRYSITLGPIQSPFLRHTHWHLHFPINVEILEKSRKLFLGRQDFRALANHNSMYGEKSCVRTMFDISIQQTAENLKIFLTGDSFLYKMARNMVGTMIWCARKKLELSGVKKALAEGDRRLTGMTAPACGLSLINVIYPNNIF